MANSIRTYLVISILLFLIIGSVILESCTDKKSQNKIQAQTDSPNYFIGDDQCQSCHSKEYNLWKTSDHFLAMLPANDTTVLGDFENTTLKADGILSKFTKKDQMFIVNTQGPDGNYHDYEIKYTFGVKPLQQYLVEFPGGRMQVLRQSWPPAVLLPERP